jgi:hypothetical protein
MAAGSPCRHAQGEVKREAKRAAFGNTPRRIRVQRSALEAERFLGRIPVYDSFWAGG